MGEVNPMQLAFDLAVRSGALRADELTGCTDAELQVLAERARCSLPTDYLQLMRLVGRSAGALFKGSDFRYPTVLELDDWATELLEENETSPRLPDDAWVFLMHQGYMFHFVDSSGCVWSYFEGDEEFKPAATSILAFVREALQELPKRT